MSDTHGGRSPAAVAGLDVRERDRQGFDVVSETADEIEPAHVREARRRLDANARGAATGQLDLDGFHRLIAVLEQWAAERAVERRGSTVEWGIGVGEIEGHPMMRCNHWSEDEHLAARVRDIVRSLPPKTWDVHLRTRADDLAFGEIDSADVHALVAAILAVL